MCSFNHCFLPRTDCNLRETVSVRPITSASVFRASPAYPQIAALIHTIVLRELRFYKNEQRALLASLLKREDFTINSVFNSLCAFPGDNTTILDDSESNVFEYISERSLTRFFRRNGFFASAGELQAIIKRLDLNYDGVITKEELSRFLVNANKGPKLE